MYALCCRECFPEHKRRAAMNYEPFEMSKDPAKITRDDTAPEYAIMVDDSERYCKCNLKGHLRAGHHAWVAGFNYDYEQPFETAQEAAAHSHE